MEGGVSDSTGAPRILRVAVVSEHTLARAGIAQAIDAQPDLRVCCDFDNCRAMVGQVMRSPPDVVVLEIAAGGGDVMDALARCRCAAPKVALVVITHCHDADIAERCIKAGALAVLHKTTGPNTLAEAIREAAAGRLHVCPCIASPLLQKAIYGKGAHKKKHPELAALSEREFQIFQLLGSGWDNARMSKELGISVKTLNAHKENLKVKLALPSSQHVRRAATTWQTQASVQ
jgi:DNA-binding NarL/FixJ family response regulator